MQGPAVADLPGLTGLDQSQGTEDPLEPLVAWAPEPPDPLDAITDSTLLQMMQSAYERSKSARENRRSLNTRNWNAFHGKFDFLSKKKPGQSTIVIPSLETSLEQVCSQLATQLVGQTAWFSTKYEGDLPPLPGLAPEQAAKILRQELDRLAIDSGCMPTTYGMGRLIHDSLKIGSIESEITWKVLMEPEDQPVYQLGVGGGLEVQTTQAMRLRVDLIPFDDHYPDPSPARHYNIHEVEVAVADLPAMGFSPDEIALMRQATPGTEKTEERRRRTGVAATLSNPTHTVLLREYWGDLIHPQTGEMLEPQCFFVTAGGSTVVRRPVRIRDLYWHGLRPFISTPLLPTPTSELHHAFLDIAVPLVEAECELFNLLCDAGFHAGLGVKEIRSYMLKDPTAVQGGIVAGLNLEIAEGRGDGDVVKRVDTGTLSTEMLTIYDRIARTRQEAMRTNDLQLGRQAQRKTSATEITQIDQASDDLFSTIALRVEDNQIEPFLELCWLTLWQFADQPMLERIGAVVGPEHAQSIGALTPEERFVAFASAVGFKVQGYKYQLAKTKDVQKIMALMQMVTANPALAQVVATQFSPIKIVGTIIKSLGIDEEELKPGPNDPQMDPMLLANQSGGQNPAQNPAGMGQQEQATPPNEQGFRGPQLP